MISLPGYDHWLEPPDEYIDPDAKVCWRCERVVEDTDLCICGSGECKECCTCKLAWTHFYLKSERGKRRSVLTRPKKPNKLYWQRKH